MTREEILIRKRESVMSEFYNRMQELTALNPCQWCTTVKYILTPNGLIKACDKECSRLSKYNSVIDELASYFKSLLEKIENKPPK